MNTRTAIILIVSLITFNLILIQSASSHNHGIESQLLTVNDQDSQYSELITNDSDEVEVVPDRSWKVPRGQFDVGLPIYGTIFGFLTAWDEDDPISLFIRAIYVMSFVVCVQVYFGFYLSCHRRQDSCCPFIPELKYNKIDFGSTAMDVSFGRWISGPFTWISEVISFLPVEAYEYLEQNAYFPRRSVIHLIFMVQLLYYFGMWDCYRSNVMAA